MKIKRTWWIPTTIIIFILAFAIPYICIFWGNFVLSHEVEDWAAFGTYFGLCATALSVIFIYLTYHDQTNMSSVLLFESSFFQWLAIHREIYSGVKTEMKSFYNDTVFKYIENKSSYTISSDLIKKISADKVLFVEGFKPDDNDLFYTESRNMNTGSQIMIFYRHLYQMYKYIYLNKILNESQKKKYYDIMQSQLTSEDLFVILYILLSDKRMFCKSNLEALNNRTYISILDESHIFKSIYYLHKSDERFIKFRNFMFSVFPKTKDSFYNLNIDIKDRPKAEI